MPIYARFLPMSANAPPDRRPMPRARRRLRPLRPGPGVLPRLDQGRRPLYELRACAVRPGSVATTTGFAIGGVAGLEALAEADTSSFPATARSTTARPSRRSRRCGSRPPAARGWRRSAPARSRWPTPGCSTAGGRPRTGSTPTSSRGASPESTVDPTRSTSTRARGDLGRAVRGIDLCLHLVRADHGERLGAAGRAGDGRLAASRRAARRSSSSARCPPDTARTRSRRSAAGRSTTSPSRSTSPRSPTAPAVSPRTFARRFVAETGTTPLSGCNAQRVLEAQRLLEHTDLDVEQVAARSGFGSAPSLREHFRRATATTPTAYRRAFAPS